jgi:hypothetical protein
MMDARIDEKRARFAGNFVSTDGTAEYFGHSDLVKTFTSQVLIVDGQMKKKRNLEMDTCYTHFSPISLSSKSVLIAPLPGVRLLILWDLCWDSAEVCPNTVLTVGRAATYFNGRKRQGAGTVLTQYVSAAHL